MESSIVNTNVKIKIKLKIGNVLRKAGRNFVNIRYCDALVKRNLCFLEWHF